LYSISGQAKSIEDTEKLARGLLPANEAEENTYRVAYAVHRELESMSDTTQSERQPANPEKKPTEFIGLVTLKSLNAYSLALPEDLTLPALSAATILTVELAYSFLPTAWGKGYATESLAAVLESCKAARSFWLPFSKLYVRTIVNEGNPASLRVMDKTGMAKRGNYEWTGKAVFLAGEWRERDSLFIFGMHLLE
jgi:RimJ/RimL family protein N-acetyltransferase